MELTDLKCRILIAEDSADDADRIEVELRRAGLASEVRRVAAESDFIAALDWNPELVICGYAMPQFDAIRALALLREHRPHVPLIMVSDVVGDEVAFETMRHGATDYLFKDRFARFPLAARGALQKQRMEREHQRVQAALRESRETVTEILRHLHAGILVLDRHGLVLSLNDAAKSAAAQLFGRALEPGEDFVAALQGQAAASFGEATAMLRAVLQEQAGSSGGHCEIRTQDPVRCFRFRACRLETTATAGVVVELEETPQRRHLEDLLALRARTLDRSSDAALVLDVRLPGAPVCYANPAFTTKTGYASEDVLGTSLRALVVEDADASAGQELADTLAQGREARITLQLLCKDGRKAWTEVHLAPVTSSAAGTAYMLVVLSDVTDVRAYRAPPQRAVQYDPLTGLPNRQLLEERLQQALAQARPHGGLVGLVSIDLDRFRFINHGFGHAAGDRVLQHVAAVLGARLAEGDTLARSGGAEFMATITSAADSHALLHLVEECRRMLAEPFLVDGVSLMITASFGVAMFPRDAGDAAALRRNADLAAQRAKTLGGNQWRLFARDLKLPLREQFDMQIQLHRAISCSEFVLLFQPLVEVAAGRVVGAEALLCWQHPTRGLVLPGEFVALAEQTGLILPIGEWALDRACEQLRAWQRAGHADLRMALSVSARQLHQPQFVKRVGDAAQRAGVDCGALELEISERALLQDDAERLSVLDQLKGLGVQLALDDFGAGAGAVSVGSLLRLPVDRIKIDRSLLNGFPEARDDAAIIGAIVCVGREIGFSVTAKGIERQSQMQALRALGCHEAQGFLLGRPMPAAQFERLLAAQAGSPA